LLARPRLAGLPGSANPHNRRRCQLQNAPPRPVPSFVGCCDGPVSATVLQMLQMNGGCPGFASARCWSLGQFEISGSWCSSPDVYRAALTELVREIVHARKRATIALPRLLEKN
jgi:hypothetical protein